MLRFQLVSFLFLILAYGCSKKKSCDSRISDIVGQISSSRACSSDSDCTFVPLVCGVTSLAPSVVNKNIDLEALEANAIKIAKECDKGGACATLHGEIKCISNLCEEVLD